MLNKRIIIIEDEPIIALDFKSMLDQLENVNVGIYFKATAALSDLYNNKPDLVLLDINLKDDLSGYEIAEKLIEEQIPFIIITGSSSQESKKKLKKSRANEILLKPINPADLISAVNKVIKN
jgi:DNA-binding response OmpR family regulator